MKTTFKRFDMTAPPVRTKWYLRPLTYLLSVPDVRRHRLILTRTGTEGLKPPYVLLCNHNAFMDFKAATMAIWPHRANYVVAIDGFIGREWLLRNVGCICKRKFTSDISLVFNLQKTIRNGDIAVIYPEARYSLCGTTAVLPASLGKLCRLLRVPVVTLICHGHHVNSPFWNLHDRGVKPTEAEMTCLFTREALEKATVEEVNAAIEKAFQYDDYAWQKEKGIRVTYEGRAEGLQKVLYQCPCCGAEYRMNARGARLFCESCGKVWEMDELSELHAPEGETEFSHIPDWYEWERSNVRREVEAGTYAFTCKARVDALPNAKGYMDLGMATLTHDMTGFTLDGSYKGEDYHVHIPAASLYSVHIEYEYLGKYGDCVDLNTDRDTLYVYPKDCLFAVTKFALATEELYQFYERQRKAGERKD